MAGAVVLVNAVVDGFVVVVVETVVGSSVIVTVVGVPVVLDKVV